MTEAEQTFQLIKDLYLDESLPKTQRDYQKFNELLAAIKFRIKAKILLDVMKAKGEESIKVFDDAIAAIETKLQALESAPYGQDKTPAELMKEDFEANKRKYNAKVTAFRDYLALLKDLRAQIEVLDKNDPESVRTLVEKVFSPELKNDDQFQSELVASLALGYFDFTPLNGEYLPKGARGDGKSSYVPSSSRTEPNYDFVDSAMHILLDPEKVEKYSKYVEALAEVRDNERAQMANHDRLEYTKWYLSHKEELDGLASTLSINKNQLELKQSQRDSLKLTIDNMQISLERLTSNKLKEFLHKVTIGDVQAKLENLRGELRTVNEDIKILEATRDGAYHRVEELIGELRGVISNQAFQSVYNSYIMPNRSSEFRFSYYAGNLPELEAREVELKAATAKSKQKLNEVKMSMTPEMREEAERNGFFLGTILNVKNRRVRYDLTPYASLVILKVLSDARHLPPEELFKQIEPEGDYDTFSAAVQARIERFLENNSVLGETRAQKAVEDKFKRFEPLRGEPLPVKPLEAETKQEEVPLPGEPNFEEGNPFGLN